MYCPSNTRWSAIFLQMIWCIRHVNEIIRLKHSTEENIAKYIEPIKGTIDRVLLEAIPSLIVPLHFVAAAVNEAQSDSFQAAYTFTLVKNLQTAIKSTPNYIATNTKESGLQKTAITNSTALSESLNKSISYMYAKHSQPSLLQLMYILTPEGRTDFRSSFPSVVVTNDPPEAKIGEKGFNPMTQEKI